MKTVHLETLEATLHDEGALVVDEALNRLPMVVDENREQRNDEIEAALVLVYHDCEDLVCAHDGFEVGVGVPRQQKREYLSDQSDAREHRVQSQVVLGYE